MSTRRDVWLPALVGVAAAVRLAAGEAGNDEPQTTPAAAGAVRSAPELAAPNPVLTALLDGLVAGDRLGDWTVERLEGSPDDVARVWVARDGVRWAAELRRRGRGPGPAPLTAGRFDLFYGNLQPEGARLEPAEFLAVLSALAERVARTAGGS
jgi:hypothetical protein